MLTEIEYLNIALEYKDPHWAVSALLRRGDLDRMDDELVKRHHPLAFQAGSQQNRFIALHRAGYRF